MLEDPTNILNINCMDPLGWGRLRHPFKDFYTKHKFQENSAPYGH